MKHLFDLDSYFIISDIKCISEGKQRDIAESIKIFRRQKTYLLNYIKIRYYKGVHPFDIINSLIEI